jgi:acetyltransferase-like isoleucine patch superfamily enzyme
VYIGNNVVIHAHVVIESGVTIEDGVEIFPGTYIGKRPKGAGATVRNIEYDEKVIIKENCSIGPNAVIYYDVSIGKNTLIGDGASIREKVSIGDFCIIGRGTTIHYNTVIGNRTKIMDLTHITGNCNIGDDVFISVCVATTNDNSIGKLGYDKDRVIGPKISNGACIGAGANILPGVSIGEGAIIAASSVVTKNVPPYMLVAGFPARPVRKLE